MSRRIFTLLMLCTLLGAPLPTAQAGKKVAFLVGINKYKKPGFNELKYAERDVTETSKELKQLGFEVTTLVGPQVTKTDFETTIGKLVAPLSSDDLILVMLAGHGQQRTGGDAYYCPYDAIIDNDETLVSLTRLLDKTLAPNVGTKLLLIDACRNDPDPGRGRSAGIQGKVIALPEDTAVMFSCRSGQQSFENDKIQHGVFTYCLLDALRGGGSNNGEINWLGLLSHVSRKMSSDEMKVYLPSGRQQTPIPAGGVPFTVLARVETKPITPKMTPVAPDLENQKTKNPTMTLVEKTTAKDADSAKTITNSIGMQLTLIPAGEFMMGSPVSEEGRRDDESQHKVRITKPFQMATTEVTQKEWQIVMSASPWRGKDGTKEGKDFPATYVSWNDAIVFCEKLTARERKLKTLNENERYRLPTEAEWEYACRAGSQNAYTFGDNVSNLEDYAWLAENAWKARETYAHQTGQKRANDFGLFDIHGNVWEWCSDLYRADYYLLAPLTDPQGPSTANPSHILRGGAWHSEPVFVRSASRRGSVPDYRSAYAGFRVVKTVTP